MLTRSALAAAGGGQLRGGDIAAFLCDSAAAAAPGGALSPEAGGVAEQPAHTPVDAIEDELRHLELDLADVITAYRVSLSLPL